MLDKTYTTMGTVNTAIGSWTALDKVSKNNLDLADTGIVAKRDAYATKLASYSGKVSDFMRQVDRLAAALLKM